MIRKKMIAMLQLLAMEAVWVYSLRNVPNLRVLYEGKYRNN
jgi:hypothetical protein